VGIYDRDYYRQQPPGLSLGPPRTAVVILIVANVAVYLLNGLFENLRLSDLLSAHVGAPADSLWWQMDTLTHPLLWWQFVTYGFMHDPKSFQHIIFNMLTLFFLGRDVEEHYGRAEFLRLYFVLLVFSGVASVAVNAARAAPIFISLMGASGAITGIVALYALLFPRRMLLFMFVIPMPAWVLGLLMILLNMFGGMGVVGDPNVAYEAHLAGAAFALLYYQQRWNFGNMLRGRFSWLRLRGRPSLRIHTPQDKPEDKDAIPEAEVDRILEKIHSQGESSLTRKERRILESASREYQKRRNQE
jgi:membrane associated rhomboid family serine protease